MNNFKDKTNKKKDTKKLKILANLPLTLTSHISIPVYIVLSFGQVDIYSGGRVLINAIPCVTLLTVTFITDVGHPDLGS